MNKQNILKPLIATLAVIALFFIPAGSVPKTSQSGSETNSLILFAPPFIRSVEAQSNPEIFEIGEKLDEEAGISAYYQSPDLIDLAHVRGVFTTIEIDTSDYIIGSVSVEDYNERYDAHVYVHRDGWILAYYFKDEPVSKIVYTKTYNINTSKLISAISEVASAAGVPFSEATYYDFRYPNATNMMFVYEDNANGNDFIIQLPSSYSYYERSYIVSGYPSYGFQIDGVSPTPTYAEGYLQYGFVAVSQLQTEIPHTLVLRG